MSFCVWRLTASRKEPDRPGFRSHPPPLTACMTSGHALDLPEAVSSSIKWRSAPPQRLFRGFVSSEQHSVLGTSRYY